MERLVFRGKVTAICPDGDDVIAATEDALVRVDRQQRIQRIVSLPTDYTLDLHPTERAIFWTEQTHRMQAAWRRRACAIPREGGTIRPLTEELSWTCGFVRAPDVVIGATLRAFLRFDLEGTRLDDLHVSPGRDADEDDPRQLAYTTSVAVRDGRLHWSTHKEIVGVSRICSIALEGGDVRVEEESLDEDLVIPGAPTGLADDRQHAATAGGIDYVVRDDGLFAATPPSFWERLRGLR